MQAIARREGVYVLRMDSALLVKQLQRLPGGMIKVISRNPAYEPFTIKTAELARIFQCAVEGAISQWGVDPPGNSRSSP